jgi:integrase
MIYSEVKMSKRTYGTGSLIKKEGSPYFYALFYRNGRQVSVSTKTKSRMVAERFLAKQVSAVQRGEQLPSDIRKLTYEDLRDALVRDYQLNHRKSLYLDADGKPKITATKHIDKFFGGYRVPAITSDEIRRFILERQAEKESSGTTNRALSMLKRMFHLAIESSKLQTVPVIKLLKEAPARKGFLELEQFRRLRQELPEHLRPIATVAYFTGMRVGELKGLRWDAVDLPERVLRLHAGETKNDEPRVVPLNQETVQMLEMVPRKGDYVFGGSKPLGSFRKAWASACKRAGIAVLFHDLRRSGVRNLRRAGVAREVAMKISGHKTESVYRRYSIVDEGDLRDAVRKLDNFLFVTETQPEIDANLMQVEKLQ